MRYPIPSLLVLLLLGCGPSVENLSAPPVVPAAQPEPSAPSAPTIAGEPAAMTETEHSPTSCTKKPLLEIAGKTVYRLDSSQAIYFQAGMAIDADGSPRAFCPDNKGLDHTANAGKPGNWWAVVTGTDKNPILQGPNDPHPGCYVSTTSLTDKTRAETDWRRYVNSETVPYIALPPRVKSQGAINIGDLAVVKNLANGKWSYAIFADVGPAEGLGEGSIALAVALGIPNTSPRNGGAAKGIAYFIFPKSGQGNGIIPENAAIETRAQSALEAVGGMRILDCLVQD